MSNGTVTATEFDGEHGQVFVACGSIGDYSITATWWGGPYVDLSMDGGDTAYDCLNVWDYEAGEPTIARTAAALAVRLAEYLGEEGKVEELGCYLY